MTSPSLKSPAGTTSNRLPVMIVFISVLIVLAVELPWISRPPFDAHCFRQAQTLSTIELFARDGIDLAHAKANYVGEPGLFVLELPLFQALCALLYDWFGNQTWIVRALNLLFTFGNALLTFAIARRLFNREAGFAAMVIYLFAPLNLVYLASTLIDPSATFGALTAFLFASRILFPTEAEGAASFGSWALFALTALLTALTKTLYLFPVCTLLAAAVLVRRRISLQMFGIGLCLLLAGGLFFLWLRHSHRVNDASYFTRGISPTTLLGFEALRSPAFYEDIARRVLFHLMGPAGTILAAMGLVSTLVKSTVITRSARFPAVLLTITVLGYLVAFSKANQHDYYALIVSPFACAVAGFGANEVARRFSTTPLGRTWVLARPVTIALLVGLVSTAMFFKRPRLAPFANLIELQQLSEGLFERWSFAMVFVAPDPRLPLPGNIGAHVPEALYATGLRGTGRLILDGASALAIWNEQRPHYQHLKYVVFYGVRPPPQIVQSCREIIVENEQRQWFAYRVE